MYNLFFCHTPYHLILSSGIVKAELKNDVNYLIIKKDFDINNINLKDLEEVFNKVIIIHGNFDNKNKNKFKLFNNYKNIINDIKNLNSIWPSITFNRLFLSVDDAIIDQKAIQLAKQGNESCKFIYVEDGTAIYNGYTNNYSNPWMVKILKRIIFNNLLKLGKYRKELKFQATHPELSEIKATWPKLVREGLDRTKVTNIEDLVLVEGVKSVYKDSIDFFNGIEENNTLFLLDNSENKYVRERDYIEIVTNILEYLLDRDSKIYIKYHPRESIYYLPKKIFENKNVVLIDRNVPAEAFFVSALNKKNTIISTTSTSLITGAKIDSNSKIISISKLINIKDSNLFKLFINLGVLMPNDLDDLKRLLG